MSWSGGRLVADDMINSLNKWTLDDMTRFRIYIDLLESLRSLDWDCFEESIGQDEMYDRAVGLLYGE